MVARWYAPDPQCEDGPPVAPSPASSVVGFDGSVLARVSWYAESDQRARVVVEGDIDRDTASLLRAHLLEALAQRRVVCCDLRRTDFFGAAGVDTLMQVRAAAAADGGSLVLAGVGDPVDAVLRATGVEDLFTVER
jgi:anti-anti-sigma factor